MSQHARCLHVFSKETMTQQQHTDLDFQINLFGKKKKPKDNIWKGKAH